MGPAQPVESKGLIAAEAHWGAACRQYWIVIAEAAGWFADLELGHDAQRDCLGGHACVQVDKSKALAAGTRPVSGGPQAAAVGWEHES